jgi:hypothetical protein
MEFTRFRWLLTAFFLFVGAGLSQTQCLSATITIDAATTVTSFYPVSVFGSNLAYWNSKSDYVNVQPKVQAAGQNFLRFPGGSSSDDYHWNGTGSFSVTSMGSYGVTYYVPNDTTYTPGFPSLETYRGTTSTYGVASNITDGNNATFWLSNKDTDLPNNQWAELDFAGTKVVNAVTIVWGNAVSSVYPYPVSFVIQYANVVDYPPPYLRSPESVWSNTSSQTIVGTGGTQGVAFTAVSSQYFRILMTASSAGAGGAYSIAEVRLYNGTTQVTTNNTTSSSQTAVAVSSTDPASSRSGTWTPDFDFESYMTYLASFTPKGIPMITVNFGTGTPQEAAAWVHYANVVKHYNIRLWQIGNETEGSWETGGPINMRDYVRRYIEFYDAMKAVDPTITITGPVAGGPYSCSNLYDGKTGIQDFLSFLHAQGKDSYVDALDFHWYPYWYDYTQQNPDPSAILATPALMATFHANLADWISATDVSPNVPVLMTEYNQVASSAGSSDLLLNGLWIADWLGEFIKSFGPRGSGNMWDVLEGTSLTDPKQGGLSYLQVENNAYRYQERAHYWAMKMMAAYWAIPGDASLHELVGTACNTASLSTYADHRPDGDLSLLVVNNDPTNTYATTLVVNGFNPDPAATGWTFDSSNYQWQATNPNHAAPDTAPTTVTLAGVSNSYPVTLSPYSILVVRFNHSTVPTATVTVTPTVTATPTVTDSPTITLTPTPTATVLNTGILYPNPVREGTTVGFYYQATSQSNSMKMKLYTTAYRKVYEQDGLLATAGVHFFKFDWAEAGLNLTNGLYYVVLEDASGDTKERLRLKLFVLH